MTVINTNQRLKALENRTKWLALICGVQFAILSACCLNLAQSRTVEAAASARVIRAQGLIIEDSHGRARILLGAPFPNVAERVRRDASTASMLFLDEKGHDRLTLGEEPEPQVGGKVSSKVHRIAQGFGVVIHDEDGNERGTYGWLSNGRALITLDRPGLDAWAAIVDDKSGFAGMRVEYPPDVAWDSNAIEIGTRGKQAFVKLQNTEQRDRAVFALEEDGRTRFKTLDNSGAVTRDLTFSGPAK